MISGLVFALATLTGISAWAQGTVYFNTRFPGAGVDAPVIAEYGSGPGPAWSAALYLKQQDSYTLIPWSITTFRDGSLNPALARYVEPVVVEVPGAPQGSTVTVQMRVWFTADGSYENFGSRGSSGDLVISNLGGGPIPPADLPSTFTGFTMWIPEPSTYALGAVGALIFLAFGRKRRP